MIKTKIKNLIVGIALILVTITNSDAFSFNIDFSEKEQQYISCSKEKISLLYTFLSTDEPETKHELSTCGIKNLTIPKWLEEEKVRMENRSMWKHPSRGNLSEKDLWMDMFSIVFQLLQEVEKIFPPDENTLGSTPGQIRENLAGVKIRYRVFLDRLRVSSYKVSERGFYTMRDSFNGRGRNILPTLNLMYAEIESLLTSYHSFSKEEGFKSSVIGEAVLINNMASMFFENSLLVDRSQDPEQSRGLGFFIVMSLIGTLLISFAVYKFMTYQEVKINVMLKKQQVKTKEWSEAYSRQFLTLDVKYLVAIPVGLFSLFGVIIGIGTGGFSGVILFLAFCFAGGYIGFKMPAMLIERLKVIRGQKINNQLMDALVLLSNSLKSGMDIVQGFELVSQDLRPPIADEFALVIKNYKLGTPFEQALEGLEERVENRLLSYMVKSIILQRQVGGNLTKIFARMVENIREESKLEEKIQSLTAQQKIQAIVVGIMPWLMLLVMFFMQPDSMINFYTSPIGLFVLFFSIFWIFLGLKLVNKMGKIKV